LTIAERNLLLLARILFNDFRKEGQMKGAELGYTYDFSRNVIGTIEDLRMK
jgi:hypothetical protein